MKLMPFELLLAEHNTSITKYWKIQFYPSNILENQLTFKRIQSERMVFKLMFFL